MRLIPYARNARTHSDAQVAQIAASVREWGWTVPVLCDDVGRIIAGHGRVLAAEVLGLTEVPVIVARGWTDAQKRAYAVADNRIAQASQWDEQLLAVELDELRDLAFDLQLVGFTRDELANLIGTDAVPPLGDMPRLPDADRAPFQQMTFTLHDDQAEQVARAVALAKRIGSFDDSLNQNRNGTALALICESFITTAAAHAEREGAEHCSD